MLQTAQQHQAAADRDKARLAQPDFSHVEAFGRTWQRTHPIRCPWCQSVFFGFQPVEAPFEPHWNPEPRIAPNGISLGQRQTCGHPMCHRAEQQHQAHRSPAYHRTLANHHHHAAEAAPAQVKLTKRKTLQQGA